MQQYEAKQSDMDKQIEEAIKQRDLGKVYVFFKI